VFQLTLISNISFSTIVRLIMDLTARPVREGVSKVEEDGRRAYKCLGMAGPRMRNFRPSVNTPLPSTALNSLLTFGHVLVTERISVQGFDHRMLVGDGNLAPGSIEAVMRVVTRVQGGVAEGAFRII
jgi:hypothetical protein